MKKLLFKGSCVAVITPFADGLVDFDSFKKILDFQLAHGTQAIIVCGTTGESAVLSDDEKKRIISFAIEYVNKRVPVIAGTGSNNTADAVKLSKYAQSAGADGLMVVTPYYNKTTQGGLVAHYFAIADSADLPIMVYNVPSRTGLNILPETYAKLGAHPTINSIKEANSSVSALTETMALTGGSLYVYCGNDDEIVPFMSMGAAGVVSVLANIVPGRIQEICRLFFEGKIQESAALLVSLNELHNALFCETSPIPAKYAAKLLGLCNGETRLPLVEMADKARVENAMRNLGIM